MTHQPGRSMRLLAGMGCAALLAACSTHGQRPTAVDRAARAQPAVATRVPLVPYFRGLRTVDVVVAGTTYTFLVDTAGGRTLVTPDVAADLGCKPRGRDVSHRMNGEAVVFHNCPRLRASVSSFAIDVAPVAVLDVNKLLPSELPRLHGVLALDAFRGQVVTLDWAANLLLVHAAADAGDASVDNALPLRIATGETGTALCVLVPVQGAQDRLWFLLDSGNIKGTLVARHAVEDGSIELDSDAVARLRIGSHDREALALIADDINYDGVLGTAYLLEHVVTLDLRDAPQP